MTQNLHNFFLKQACRGPQQLLIRKRPVLVPVLEPQPAVYRSTCRAQRAVPERCLKIWAIDLQSKFWIVFLNSFGQ